MATRYRNLSVILAALVALTAVVFAPRTSFAQDKKVEAAAKALQKKAMEDDYLATEFAKAQEKLEKALASCGADGRLMLWDLSLPQNTPVLTMEALDGWEAWAMDFDKSGRRLLATNSIGTTITWDLRHFNRHIGGNMEAQIKAHRATLGDRFNEAAAMEQRELLLSRGKRTAASPDQ